MGFFGKLFGSKEKESLDQGLQKTKESFLTKITKAIAGKSTVDEEVLDNLEEALIGADVGLDTTIEIIKRIEEKVAQDKYVNTSDLNRILQEQIRSVLVDSPEGSYKNFATPSGKKPYVILVVGVNGVGKTTTIGKLAYNFTKAGKSVLLGAADTFRAAAVDQLTIWSERTNVPIVKQAMGSDPSAVAFDTVQSGVARGSDPHVRRRRGLRDVVADLQRVGRQHVGAHLEAARDRDGDGARDRLVRRGDAAEIVGEAVDEAGGRGLHAGMTKVDASCDGSGVVDQQVLDLADRQVAAHGLGCGDARAVFCARAVPIDAIEVVGASCVPEIAL